MFYYRDNKIEYLTYLNSYKNEIQFYDLRSKQLSHKISCSVEGPNGVGKISGFRVISKDSVFLTSGYSIFLVDSCGRIKKKYSYKTSKNGKLSTVYYSTSRLYIPLIVKSGKLYLIQNLTFEIPFLPKEVVLPSINSKVCLVIHGDGQNEYLPMEHPLSHEEGLYYGSTAFSREFGNESFVYSFVDDQNIYVTKDHINVKKYNAKSKFIDKIDHLKYNSMPSMERVSRDLANRNYYYNIIYDTYRNVYYRFVKLSDDYQKGDDLMKLIRYPKNFSIIILNKDFQVIGETRFPSKTYVFQEFFVTEDGLYLSTNHIDNPNLDINHLQFELMKLAVL